MVRQILKIRIATHFWPFLRASVPIIGGAAVLAPTIPDTDGGARWLAHLTLAGLLCSLVVLTVERLLGGGQALVLGSTMVVLTGLLALGRHPRIGSGCLQLSYLRKALWTS